VSALAAQLDDRKERIVDAVEGSISVCGDRTPRVRG